MSIGVLDDVDPSGIYGLVSMSDNYEHNIQSITEAPWRFIGPVPDGTIPSTTELDYFNTVPDTDIDDIVEVRQDESSMGTYTGSMYFEPAREQAQVVIPLFTDVWSPLPVHGYLAQGGFSADSGLRSKTWVSEYADERGQPYAYSLDTRIRRNIYLNTPYNHVKRIEVSAKDSGNQPIAGRQFSYSFNAVGNRTEAGWVCNSLNQVQSVPGEGGVGYDDRGNVIYHLGWTARYDAADRLIEIGSGSGKLTFGYDAQGRRIWRKRYTGYGALLEEKRFAYDGWNLIGEFLVENGTPRLLKSYVWGPDLGGGIGGLLAIKTVADGAMYYPFYDGSGNVMGLMDSTGAVVASYEYDPFGKLLSAAGPKADLCPFRFQSKYYDEQSGLYDFGYRYYSPKLQRFISRDPIEEEGGVNLYAYCGNDPVNRNDALGLWPATPAGIYGASCWAARGTTRVIL